MPSQQASHIICKTRSGLGWMDMLRGKSSPKRAAYNKCMESFGFVGGRVTRRNRRVARQTRRSGRK